MHAAQYVDHERVTATSEIVSTGFVFLFVGPDFVITVRQGTVMELGSLRADLSADPRLLAGGPWSVAHAVLDRLVDAYVETNLAEALAGVSRLAHSGPDKCTLRDPQA